MSATRSNCVVVGWLCDQLPLGATPAGWGRGLAVAQPSRVAPAG